MSFPLETTGPSSPAPMPPPAAFDEDEDANSEIPRRLMQVKVLYTFDDGNKTNCLARLPHALSIPTVQLDDNAQVGVIELKTCIQAIVQHSPELVGKLDGHDYTVYAYDYSEYETPLVGQGMLSWVLASASPTPNAPAHESRTMITGRVCKNIMGLFTKGPKETLEVKLKLVPVPTVLQKEYLDSMEKYRSVSKFIPGEFDPNTWAAFLKANPGITEQLSRESSQASTEPVAQRTHSRDVESIHQLLRQNSFSDPQNQYHPGSYGSQSQPVELSRASSPTPSFRSVSALQQAPEIGSRPGSRASTRSERPIRPRLQSYDASAISDTPDDGPAKKRARITKAKWKGKSSFGANNESLLQTASTANSVRVHRPTPLNAPPSIANSIEPPPRAPTPRPEDTSGPFRRRPSNGSSLLRIAATRNSSPQRELSAGLEAATEVGDYDQAGDMFDETPMEFPSSPPVMRYDTSPLPSSPAPLALPYPSDSGFVSDTNVDSEGPAHVEMPKMKRHVSNIEDTTRDPNVPIPRPWPPEQYRNKHQPWMSVMPGPAAMLPTKSRPFDRHTHSKARSAARDSRDPASAHQAAVPQQLQYTQPYPYPNVPPPNDIQQQPYSLPPNPEQNKRYQSPYSSCPPIPAPKPTEIPTTSPTDQVPAYSPPLQTTETNASASPNPMTNEPTKAIPKPRKPSDSTQRFKPPPGSIESQSDSCEKQPRSGSGGTRNKNVVTINLEQSIAAGQPPRFCENCGEIRTSTWRKAFSAIRDGTPDNVVVVENKHEEGGIVGFEIIESDTPKYRIFKKNLFKHERNCNVFSVHSLCNPCGLWFDKYGNMRPSSKWGRKTKKSKASKNQGEPMSEIGQEPPSMLHTDSNMSDAVFDGAVDTYQAPAPKRPRASSASLPSNKRIRGGQWVEDASVAALQRAIQSSPARFMGSQTSPIEIEADLTPKPTRRLLFPSPRSTGDVKSLADSPRPTKPAAAASTALESTSTSHINASLSPDDSTIEDNDKENNPPQQEDDGLDHLFEDSDFALTTTPKRKSKTTDDINPKMASPTLEQLLRTPASKVKNRIPLTPRHNSDPAISGLGIDTPSRSTTRTTGITTSPFGSQLAALHSDNITGSPLRGFDFGNFPTFQTPGKNGFDYLNDDWLDGTDLGTDIPMPSSDPPNFFALYEDPETSTTALWDGTDIFSDMQVSQGASNSLMENDSFGEFDESSLTVVSTSITAVDSKANNSAQMDLATFLDGVSGSNESAAKENNDNEKEGPVEQIQQVDATASAPTTTSEAPAVA